MTSVLDSATKISGYIAECKELGIPVLPPDINHSYDHFSVEDEGIRFGLGAVKNVGRGLIRSMVAKRDEGGPFKSMEDFLERMGEGELNKRAVENFIKCGAMDGFGHHRSELLAVYESMMDSVSSIRKRNLDGQMGMFSMLNEDDSGAQIPIPSLPELKKADLMAMEKETTGIYISGHPMDDYRQYLKGTRVIPIGVILGEDCPHKDDDIVSIAGIVQSIKMKTTRNNSMMAYVTIEDDTGALELLAFSNVLNEYGAYLRENSAVVITGRLSVRDEKDSQIIVNRARPITDFSDNLGNDTIDAGLTLYLQLQSESDPNYQKVKDILNRFPGQSVVKLFFADTRKMRGTTVTFQRQMLNELENLLGNANVVLK